VKPLVVVPAFNEEASIGQVIAELIDSAFDFVVVDDGSTDQTKALAERLGARVLALPLNSGVGSALRCGFRYAVEAGFDTVIQVDADGQHHPSEISKLLAEAERGGHDMVIGSRFMVGGGDVSRIRRFPMKVISFVASRAAGTRLTDATSGFRLIRGDLLLRFASNFPRYYLGDTFEATYVAGKAGYRIAEVAVVMSPRTNGRSSANVREAVTMIIKTLAVTLLGLHFRIPSRHG
jgi:glycosyltransferase involved in cell wall biosynthesis